MSRKLDYSNLLDSYEWQVKRQRIIERAHGVCEWCGKFTDDFNVHHKEYDAFHPADTDDEKLVAICRDCHAIHHWNMRILQYEKAKKEHIARHGWLSPRAHEELVERFEV